MEDLKDFGCFISIILLIVVVLFAPIIGLGVWATSTSCRQQADVMGVEHQWGFFTDCMVKIDGKWIPLSSYVSVEKNQRASLRKGAGS